LESEDENVADVRQTAIETTDRDINWAVAVGGLSVVALVFAATSYAKRRIWWKVIA
jgi:acetaldehyde dehydrogenase (acetylating)